MEISTSILSVKPEAAIKTFYNLETAGTNYFHIDVMDGQFVPNDTSEIMLKYCEYLDSITMLPLDVHLMVRDVESYIKSYLIFEPNMMTVHVEAAQNKEELLQWIHEIKEANCRAGVSIKPNTPIEDIYSILPYLHHVLIMTVEPGFGGQAFIDGSLDKVRQLREAITRVGCSTLIEIDGGITVENAGAAFEAGCDILVAGNTVFGSGNPTRTIEQLLNA